MPKSLESWSITEEDRVIEVLVRPERGEREAVVAGLGKSSCSRFGRARSPASSCCARHRTARRRKRRNAAGTRAPAADPPPAALLVIDARQLRIRLDVGDVKPRLPLRAEPVAEVRKEPLRVLLRVLAEAVLRKVGEAHVVIERPEHLPGTDLPMVRVEAAVRKPGAERATRCSRCRRRNSPRRPSVVDRTPARSPRGRPRCSASRAARSPGSRSLPSARFSGTPSCRSLMPRP